MHSLRSSGTNDTKILRGETVHRQRTLLGRCDMTISIMVKNSKPKKVAVQVLPPFWHSYMV